MTERRRNLTPEEMAASARRWRSQWKSTAQILSQTAPGAQLPEGGFPEGSGHHAPEQRGPGRDAQKDRRGTGGTVERISGRDAANRLSVRPAEKPGYEFDRDYFV